MGKPDLPKCDRFPDKKQYETEGDALDAAERSTKREHTRIYYYLCSDCHQYHLTKYDPATWKHK
jgi:hypothetical protein